MKCAIVYADGCRQIMLEPENSVEKEAIKAMRCMDNEQVRVVMNIGGFDDQERQTGYFVGRCQGGYFRRFAQDSSLMIEITEKQEHVDGQAE